MAWQLRTRWALALLTVAWVWAYTALGGVALAHRCLLLVAAALATALVLWPPRQGAYPDGTPLPTAPRFEGWHFAVGLMLYGGVVLAPVSQIPGWILAALAWSSLGVVDRAVMADQRLLRLLPTALLMVATGQALLGLWQAKQGMLVRGTLRNPNHFAGAMALALGLALGLSWWIWRRSESRRWVRWLAPSAGLLLLSAVVASGSRGGLLTAGAVLAFVYLRLRLPRRGLPGGRVWHLGGPRRAIFLALWGLAWGAATLWMTTPRQIEGLERRLLVYQGTAEMVVDHPWFGVGPGLYRWSFRPYQRFDTAKHFDHAHNDYLEIAAEWGLPLSLLLWFFVGRRWWSACRGVEAVGGEVIGGVGDGAGGEGGGGRPGARQGIALGVAAGLLAPLVHGWVDFDLHIPVLAMQAAMLLALAKGLGHHDGLASLGQGALVGSSSRRHRVLCSTLSLTLLALLILAVVRVEGLRLAYGDARGSDHPEVLEKAIAQAPRAASLHFQLAMLRRDAAPYRDPKAAKEHFETAIRLNPHSWRYRVELGWFYEQLGLHREAWQAYRQALRLNPRDADYQRRLGGFALRRGALSQGKALLAQAVAQDPRRLAEGGALLLSAVSPAEVVAWWPREAGFQSELLELLCRHFASQPAVMPEDERLLAKVWRRWLEASSGMASSAEDAAEAGDIYVRYLLDQGRGEEARRQWLRRMELDPSLPAATLGAFASRHNLIWNGDFEAPLRQGALAWQVPGQGRQGGRQSTFLAPGEGVDGSTALAIDFDKTPKNDFKRLRQHLIVEPSTAYVLNYHLRSEQLAGPGLFLQVIAEGSRRQLMRSETILGTIPWRHGRRRFETPASTRRVVVRLALGPGVGSEVVLDGRLYIDGLRVEEEDSP